MANHHPRHRSHTHEPEGRCWDGPAAVFIGLRVDEFQRVLDAGVHHSTRDEATGMIAPARALDVFSALDQAWPVSFVATLRNDQIVYQRVGGR